jgi:hypothetical protein
MGILDWFRSQESDDETSAFSKSSSSVTSSKIICDSVDPVTGETKCRRVVHRKYSENGQPWQEEITEEDVPASGVMQSQGPFSAVGREVGREFDDLFSQIQRMFDFAGSRSPFEHPSAPHFQFEPPRQPFSPPDAYKEPTKSYGRASDIYDV